MTTPRIKVTFGLPLELDDSNKTHAFKEVSLPCVPRAGDLYRPGQNMLTTPAFVVHFVTWSHDMSSAHVSLLHSNGATPAQAKEWGFK